MTVAQIKSLIYQKTRNDPILKPLLALVGDSLVYLFGAVLLGLGNFILIPLYTRYLSPAEFGIYSLIEISLLFFVMATQLGFGMSYLKYYSDVGHSQRGEVLGSVLAIGGGAALFCGSIFMLLVYSPLGSQWLHTTERGFAWLLLPIIFLENQQALLLADLRAQRKATIFSSATVIRLMLIVGASLWFIVVEQRGLTGVFLGRLTGDLTSVLFLSFFCLPSVKLKFSRSIATSIIPYALPVVSGSLTAMLLDASGRFFLGSYGSLEEVGYYGAAIKIGSIFQILIVQPFGIAWGGLLFQIVKWPNARLIYSKILSYLFILSSSAALMIVFFTPTLFSIFATSAYAPAMTVFPFILLVRATIIMEYPTSIGFYLTSRTKLFPLIYGSGLIINIVANLLTVPLYGMFGAAWSWFAAWIFIIILMAWYGNKHYPLYYDWKLIIFPPLAWGIFLSGKLYNVVNLIPWFLQGTLAFLIMLSVLLLIASDYTTMRKNTLRAKER